MAVIIIMVKQKVVESILHRHASVLQALLLAERNRYEVAVGRVTPALLLHRKIPFMAQYHERIVPDILQLDDLQAKLLLKCGRIFFEIFFAFGFFYFSAPLFFFGGLLFFAFVFFSKS